MFSVQVVFAAVHMFVAVNPFTVHCSVYIGVSLVRVVNRLYVCVPLYLTFAAIYKRVEIGTFLILLLLVLIYFSLFLC